MAEIIQAAPLRAYDSNGDLVASARLYVYESGTTTEQTVYQDEDLTTPFSQPIEANAAGVFPPIFVASGADAKVTVTDTDDVVLPGYPIDPVALGATTSSGASEISFSPVTGNAATNVQTAIENLTDFQNETEALGLDDAMLLGTAQVVNGSKTFNGARLVGAYQALTAASSVTPDFSASNRFSLTLNQDLTIETPTNTVAGQAVLLVLTQDGTGSRLASWGSGWLFPDGTAPTLTTDAGAVDLIVGEVIATGQVAANIILNLG